MITPKLLYAHLRSDEEYNKLYDKIVKKDTDRWEESFNNDALYPTEEDLQETRNTLQKNSKKDRVLAKYSNFYYYYLLLEEGKPKQEAKKLVQERELIYTDEYVKSSHYKLFTIGGLAVSMAVKKINDKNREITIKQWKEEDAATDKRVLSVIPFDNITCKKCKTPLAYRWSRLDTMPNVPQGLEMVLFFYFCQNECGNNQLIFENGLPWVSGHNNNCAICGGGRSSTTTKDNDGNLYIIYECCMCGSRQVDKIEKIKT